MHGVLWYGVEERPSFFSRHLDRRIELNYAFWNGSRAPEDSCGTSEVCRNARIYMQHLPRAGLECYSFSSLIYMLAQNFSSCRWGLCVSLCAQAAQKTQLVSHSPAVPGTKPGRGVGTRNDLQNISRVPPQRLPTLYYQAFWYLAVSKRKAHMQQDFFRYDQSIKRKLFFFF